MKRREFLIKTGLIAAAGVVSPSMLLTSCKSDEHEKVNLKNIDSKSETDLLVVGGGPAGVCAAIAAAREGVRVTLIETAGFLGGMATRGLVGPFMTCFDAKGEIQVIRGLFEEIVQRLVTIDGAIHPSQIKAGTPYTAWITAGHSNCTPFEPEALKFVLDQMIAEAGVNVLFHTSFVEPIIADDRIEGAVVHNKAGLQIIQAQVVVDATGDADVAYRSGVSCSFGNGNGGVQPSTAFFHIKNVDYERLEADVQAHLHEFRKVDGVSYRALHWRVAEAEAAGEWDLARKSVNIYKCVKPDEWAVNCSRIAGVDSTDPASLTDAEMVGRKQIQDMMHFFHKYVPGCEKATLMASGSTLGIRESRHIEGDYVLTAEDCLNALVPENSILVTASAIDVHGGGGALKTQYRTLEKGRWYGVPYTCLLPKGIEGLIVAGRSLSATSDAAGAVRVMPPSMAMGQAAGVAAAIAIQSRLTPRHIDVQKLTATLRDRDVFLG